MKKFVIVLLAVIMSVTILSGCVEKNNNDINDIKIIMPDGAPALAMAKLLYDNFQFEGYNISYEIVAGAPDIQAKVLSGEADIAILPTNMGANFYNRDIPIKLLGSNVFGLLYMLGKTPISSLNDLKGKVVFNLGQGNTPDFVFKQILEDNDIDYAMQDTAQAGIVSLRYASDAQSLIAMMIANQVEYAILGEPQVTQAINATASTANPFLQILDLQQEWENGYPQVSTVAKSELIAAHSAFIAAFLQKLEENVAWVNGNAPLAMQALTENGSRVTGFSQQTIERCNIRFEYAQDIKEDIENYLQLMYNFNAQFVGGKMPNEGFYN